MPLMLAGTLGKPGATVLHFWAEVTPQMLVTLTQILPVLLYVGPKFTLMLLVLELPVAPVGNVQL
jgi:hypothetical protein